MFFFFFQAEDGIRDGHVTGVQTCALPIYALSPISRPRLVHLLGCRGGGLQGDGRYPAQACWYALEPPRRQRHHRPTLLSPQWSLRGLLGTPLPGEGRVTPTTLLSCAQIEEKFRDEGVNLLSSTTTFEMGIN